MIPATDKILMNVTYIHERSGGVYRTVLMLVDFKGKTKWIHEPVVVYQKLVSSLFYGKTESEFRKTFTRTISHGRI
jgi:hypothetical protein